MIDLLICDNNPIQVQTLQQSVSELLQEPCKVRVCYSAEELRAPGDLLMKTGVALKPAFSGTGFNENVRVFPDFAARIYYFEADE